MLSQSLYHTFKRYRTLSTDKITALPVVILMPHSACNCRCVMCDIWKGNHNLKQLKEEDISALLDTLQRFGTKRILMSGGEALLNPNFFRFCAILKKIKVKITLLSTGLLLAKHAEQLVQWVDDIIVSLDGDEELHDRIRNIPGAFDKMKEGIAAIRLLDPGFVITARTVIHRYNFQHWPAIINAAKAIGIDQISFLPADVSSHAFNRDTLWDASQQDDILIAKDDLPVLQTIIDKLKQEYEKEFENRFIAEDSSKIQKIHDYYAAFYGLTIFPYKKCNAPWVSTVIEADGTVRPCFFHEPIGNIHEGALDTILNSKKALDFRKHLDMDTNDTCVKCVCYLNLPPRAVI